MNRREPSAWHWISTNALWAGALLVGAAVAAGGCRRSRDEARTPVTKTSWGTQVHWSRTSIDLEPVEPPRSAGVSGGALVSALEEAAGAWNRALAGCGLPPVRVADLKPSGKAVDDGMNRVVVRTGRWCPEGTFDRDDCYERGAMAKTTVRPRRDVGLRDGEIRDVDVEINAVDFQWSPHGERPGTKNLSAVLAHELGHVLGLDHACGPARDLDGSGEACDVAAGFPSIMFPDPTAPGKPATPTPTPDAVRALCAAQRSRS